MSFTFTIWAPTKAPHLSILRHRGGDFTRLAGAQSAALGEVRPGEAWFISSGPEEKIVAAGLGAGVFLPRRRPSGRSKSLQGKT